MLRQRRIESNSPARTCPIPKPIAKPITIALAGFLLDAKIQGDWIAAILLLLTSVLLFTLFVLPQAPFLWPTVLFWIAIVTSLLFRKRSGRQITVASAVVLIVISAWYCALYIPGQMKRAFTHVTNAEAPQFTLQPISSGAVPTTAMPGKILVLDFLPPGARRVSPSCPSWSVFAPIYKLNATFNSCWSARTAAAIRLIGCERLLSAGTFRFPSRLTPKGEP